jgi:hypothetical protein
MVAVPFSPTFSPHPIVRQPHNSPLSHKQSMQSEHYYPVDFSLPSFNNFGDYPMPIMLSEYPFAESATQKLLPTTHDLPPASNEEEIQLLTSEIQAAGSELRLLGGERSDLMLYPESSFDRMSAFEFDSFDGVSRSNSCPPFIPQLPLLPLNPLSFSSPCNVEQATEDRNACRLCSKSFSEKKRLDSHITGHSSLRPYKCKRCPDSFKRAHHLRRHAKGCEQRLARRGSAFFVRRK